MCKIELRLLLLLLWGFATGCATVPGSYDTFMGEGFRVSSLGKQTRAVVAGNHSIAVNKTVDWLNDHDIIVVDRWVAKDFEKTQTGIVEDSQNTAYMLFMAHKAKAPLAVFVDVTKTPSAQVRNYSDTAQQPVTTITVETSGVNTQTSEIIFTGKAWNSKPLLESDHLIQELSAFALQKGVNAQLPAMSTTQNPYREGHASKPLALFSTTKQGDSEEMLMPESPKDPATSLSERSKKSANFVHEEHTGKSLSSQDQDPISPSKPLVHSSPSEDLNESLLQDESSIGIQVASAALSILYTPFKASYALLGGFFGGMAYLVTGGDEAVANSVWSPSLGGTYWLTPQHLVGNEPVYFLGPSPESP